MPPSMPDFFKLPRSVLTRAVLVFLCLNAALLLYYLVFDYQQLFNADSATKNLLAQEIVTTGSYFPRDWNYVNGDLWVFYSHTFIVPLLYFFSNSFRLHAVSGIVSTVLIAHATWLLGSVMGLSRLARLTMLLVLASGISPFMAENLFGQVSYGQMYFMACYLVYAGWRYVDAAGGARRWGAAAMLLTLLVFWSNPKRALVMYALPLAAGLVVLAWQRSGQQRRAWLLLGISGAGAVVGSALHALILHGGKEAPLWLGFDAMLGNTAGVLHGLLGLLGALPEAKHAVSASGGLRLLMGLAVLVLLPWGVVKASWSGHRGRQLTGIFTAVSLAASLFLIIATNVADMSDPASSVRYLVPALLFALFLLVAAVVDSEDLTLPVRLAGLGAVLVLATSAPTALHWPLARSYFPRGGVAQQAWDWRLSQFLEAQGLRYGYADYWDAGPVTIFSEQRMRLRPVRLSPTGMPLPMTSLTSNRWYRADAWQGDTCFVFSNEQAKLVDWKQLASVLGKPVRELDFENWHIVVYADNPARHFPEWDMEVAKPLHLPINAASMHHTGHLSESPRALVAQPGEAGALHFGPYKAMAPGHYIVHFTLEADGQGKEALGQVDVAAGPGGKPLVSLPIAPGARRISVPFSLKKTELDVQFRVFSNGHGRLTLQDIELARAP